MEITTRTLPQAFDFIQRVPEGGTVDIYINEIREQFKVPINNNLIHVLEDTASISNMDNLVIKVFKKNGSSRVPLQSFNIDLSADTNSPLITATKLQQNHNKTATEMQQNTNETATMSVIPANTTSAEGLLLAEYKEKYRDLKSEFSDVKQERNNLRDKVHQLELRGIEKEKEFEIQRLQERQESKAGLNGIMESVTANPEILTGLGSIITALRQPVQAQIIQQPQQQNQPVQDIEIELEEEGNNIEIRKSIDTWFKSIPEERATSVYSLLQIIAKSPDLEQKILQKLKTPKPEEHA